MSHLKTVEMNWHRATKVWWYYIWRAFLISAAANFFIEKIIGVLFSGMTETAQLTTIRILSVSVGALIGIVIFRSMADKEFSDFRVVLQKREGLTEAEDLDEPTEKE